MCTNTVCTLCHDRGQWAGQWAGDMCLLTAWHRDDEALQGLLGDDVITGRWRGADKAIEDIAVQNTTQWHLNLTGTQSQRNAGGYKCR